MTTEVVAGPAAAQRTEAGRPSRGRDRLLLAGVTVLAAAHALAVAPAYAVGSFDDDSHYVGLARALASGQGFVDTALPGTPVEVYVPPGYPALLAPLAALWPDETWPFRAVSLLAWLAVFPLAWHWMRLRGASVRLRAVVLLLLALNPVGATYATMVMAETAFLVLLLLLLIAMHQWERQRRQLTRWGLAAAATLAGLLLLKSAAAAFVPAVIGYLLLRRRVASAALVVGVVATAMLPLLLLRLLSDTSPLGSRYGEDWSGYSGDPLGHFLDIFPEALQAFVLVALPATVVPTEVRPFIEWSAPAPDLLHALRFAVFPLLVIGFLAWHRRRADVSVLIAPVYALQSVAYPFVNERRVVLLLPLVLLWVVLGAGVAGAALRLLATPRRSVALLPRLPGRAAAAVTLAVALPLLVVQFPRNYLFPPGVHSSEPEGSAYISALAAASAPDRVVASSFRWTVGNLAERPAVRGPLLDFSCSMPDDPAGYLAAVRQAVREDQVAAVLVAALKQPGEPDDPCLLELLDRHPEFAVRILRDASDSASVFQLVGPGTPYPDLSDVTVGRTPSGSNPTLSARPEPAFAPGEPAGRYWTIAAAGGGAALTTEFAGPVPVAQVSVGAARCVGGTDASVEVALRRPDGSWMPVFTSEGADVGPAESGVPYVLERFATPVVADAVRVSFRGDATFEVHDLHVLARTGTGSEAAS